MKSIISAIVLCVVLALAMSSCTSERNYGSNRHGCIATQGMVGYGNR